VLATKLLLAAAVVLIAYGLYVTAVAALAASASKRRAHDARNVLRLIAWLYITVERPFGVGDRVRIGDAKGDVISVDFLVTTIRGINGELVSTNQPSGRVVTVPNSLVLSSEVINVGGGSQYVRNEVSARVACETDLAFAREVMRAEANDLLATRWPAGSPTTAGRRRRRPSNLRSETGRRSASSSRSRGWSSRSATSRIRGGASSRKTSCTSASSRGSTSIPSGSPSP